MLIDFSFSNYLSFGDNNTFSMTSTKEKTRLKENTFVFGDLRILKSAAIYGANGSGKSNFIRAFTCMRSLVLENSSFEAQTFKLNKRNTGQPSFFEAIFSDATTDTIYRYGFEISAGKVNSEWLFFKSSSKETNLFTREGQNIEVGRLFKEGRAFTSNAKDNRLFISVVAELNGTTSNLITSWFRSIRVMSGLDMNHENTLTLLSKNGAKYKKKILEILHSFDVQMEDFTIKERPKDDLAVPDDPSMSPAMKKVMEAIGGLTKEEGFKLPPYVVTHRRVFDGDTPLQELEDFNLKEDESDGTYKLFAIAGLLVEVLDKGLTLLIDELESKLHPLITKQIVSIFNSEIQNRNNAQLIFTTHDTNLLNGGHIRRDQVWFTEKDKYGCTHLYSLAEYKQSIARGSSLEQDYITGRFGAIPFIGNINKLLR